MKRKPASAYLRGLRDELCPCEDCCKADPGRAAIVQRQRAAFKKRFAQDFERGQLRGVA